MSSTKIIQISNAEIEALTAEVETISSKDKVHLRPVLRSLLEVINENPAEFSPLLRRLVFRAGLSESVEKINASDTTVAKITEVFKLGEEQWWNLVEDGLVEVPLRLKHNLQDLKDALYDEYSEASCRIAVDIMLVQCWKYLRNKHQSAEATTSKATTTEAPTADTTSPSTPFVNKPAAKVQRSIRLFPETSLSIEMCDPFEPHRQILVAGRADWAFGYSIDGDKGALLAAIEAKKASEFSKGKAQLITYLAILRENRLRAKKTNIITQGFYSDGSQYAFICITAEGTINRSRIFDIGITSDLKMVFNFIINMMETAMKSTPNATPTKPGRQQEKEVGQFKDEVWLRIFRHLDESIVEDQDDETNVVDMSWL